ncbi:MAG: DNA-binding transcriptional regulator, partial [Myxococcota bacterium]
FDEDEVRSLVLGARMVEGWADAELRQAARSILNKVEAMLPESKLRILHDTALFAPDIRAPRRLRDRLGIVRSAKR